MSANNDQPHLLVLPEDDANRQILVGFRNHHAVRHHRRIDVQPVAGGWMKAVESLVEVHVPLMQRFPKRHVLLVIDFDNHPERYQYAMDQIPAELQHRVYILGCAKEPETLLASLNPRIEGLGKLETLGRRLAADCDQDTSETWGHAMLVHNAAEVERLKANVKGFLFS